MLKYNGFDSARDAKISAIGLQEGYRVGQSQVSRGIEGVNPHHYYPGSSSFTPCTAYFLVDAHGVIGTSLNHRDIQTFDIDSHF